MKKVIVVGGGFAGVEAAMKLEKKFDVTLIDTKDYFEYTPGVLRTIVEPKHVKKIQALHTHYLKRAQFIQAEVKDVTKTHVLLGKKKLPFDYLIIATGSSYNAPIKAKNVVQSWRGNILRECYEQLCKSKSVVIVGGGIVGVELAAEIAEHYDDKEIYLVHSRDRIMDRAPEKASKYAHKFLEKHGVKIICGERVTHKKGKHSCTDQGTKIHSDMIFLCTGIIPNTSLLKKHFKETLDNRGFAKVKDTLQLEGHKNIFVAGDATAIREEKLAQTAELHAKAAAHNIICIEDNCEPKVYKSQTRTVVISLGKWHGILTRGNYTITGRIPALLKEGIERYIMRHFKR